MQGALQSNGQPSAFFNSQALQQVYTQLGQQAGMLSYIDAIRLLMWISLASLPLVLIMRKPQAGAGGGAAE